MTFNWALTDGRWWLIIDVYQQPATAIEADNGTWWLIYLMNLTTTYACLIEHQAFSCIPNIKYRFIFVYIYVNVYIHISPTSTNHTMAVALGSSRHGGTSTTDPLRRVVVTNGVVEASGGQCMAARYRRWWVGMGGVAWVLEMQTPLDRLVGGWLSGMDGCLVCWFVGEFWEHGRIAKRQKGV